MADIHSMDSQAFSKLIEPVTTRMDALEARLERIESQLSKLTSPFATRQLPTASQPSGLYPRTSPSIIPQKRPLDQNIPEAEPAAHQPYHYRPLDASKNEIRILSLDPSHHPTDSITGTILHLSLDDITVPQAPFLFSTHPPGGLFGSARPTGAAPRYKALSYAWGDLSRPGGTNILVAGAALPVTANLTAALRQLRSSETTDARSFWWIDAVCINQADVGERNSQVALMRRIYGSAAQVQVWLGGEADGSAAALALVRRLTHPPKRGPAHPEVEYAYVPDDARRSNLACVAALFQREWWDRVWVRQEVALGSNLSFLCGGETCTLEELTETESLLQDSLLQLRLDSKRQDMAHVSKLVQTRQAERAEGFKELRDKSRRGDDYVDLCTLLLHSRSCKATDLRDKVFGVLGLADPSIYELSVDYRLPIKELYRMAATAIITKTGKLNILSASQNVDRAHSLPSWAPNLVDPWKAQPFPANTTAFSTATFQNRLANKLARCHFNASGKVLTVTGQVYGRIARLSEQAAKSTHSNHELAQVLAAWLDFARSVITAKQEPSGGLFGGLFGTSPHWKFGADLGDSATLEERCVARLLLVSGAKTFSFGGELQPKVDVAYVRSLLAPEAWIENSVANSGLQKGMRRYGVGRRVGQCKDGDVGLFPEDARTGDFVVYLYGAANPYVLRKLTGGYLLVGDANVEASVLFNQDEKSEDFQLF